MLSPKCITERIGPRMDFNGSDWLEGCNAFWNMWGAVRKKRYIYYKRKFNLGFYVKLKSMSNQHMLWWAQSLSLSLTHTQGMFMCCTPYANIKGWVMFVLRGVVSFMSHMFILYEFRKLWVP